MASYTPKQRSTVPANPQTNTQGAHPKVPMHTIYPWHGGRAVGPRWPCGGHTEATKRGPKSYGSLPKTTPRARHTHGGGTNNHPMVHMPHTHEPRGTHPRGGGQKRGPKMGQKWNFSMGQNSHQNVSWDVTQCQPRVHIHHGYPSTTINHGSNACKCAPKLPNGPCILVHHTQHPLAMHGCRTHPTSFGDPWV
jgi:hypothetical protein